MQNQHQKQRHRAKQFQKPKLKVGNRTLYCLVIPQDDVECKQKAGKQEDKFILISAAKMGGRRTKVSTNQHVYISNYGCKRTVAWQRLVYTLQERCTNGDLAQPHLVLTPNRSPADISPRASAEPRAHPPSSPTQVFHCSIDCSLKCPPTCAKSVIRER